MARSAGRVFDETILRRPPLVTLAETERPRTLAGSHSLTRYVFVNPRTRYMLRRPMGTSGYGTLNQRNKKQAVRAHYREFRRYGPVYHVKIEARRGFAHLTFPDPEASGATDRKEGRKGKSKGRQGRFGTVGQHGLYRDSPEANAGLTGSRSGMLQEGWA